MAIFNRTMVVLSVIGAIITIGNYNKVSYEYKTIWILPVVYLILYIFVYQITFRNKSIRITSITLSIYLFLRSVLNSVFISLAGAGYVGKRYIPLSNDDITFAIYLTVYELVVVSLFICILSLLLPQINKQSKQGLKLGGSKAVYLIYLVIAIILYLLVGKSENVISFFYQSISESSYKTIDGTLLLLVRQIIVTAIIIMFILLINFSKKQYDKTKKRFYINLAILAAIINIGVIVGDRRSVQIFTAILSMWILIETFKTNRKKIIITLLSTSVAILFFMTLYRWGAYQQGAYMGVIDEMTFDFTWLAHYSQVYVGGPDSIATSMVFSNSYPLSFENLIFDFGRSIFGLNFLLRDKMLLTSELYNLFLYNGDQFTGQLIFSSSYGYMYFGFVGAPIIIIINISISILLERMYRRSLSYETAYLFGYCLLRMALNLLINTPTVINVITLMLGTLGLLIIVSRIISGNRLVNDSPKVAMN